MSPFTHFQVPAAAPRRAATAAALFLALASAACNAGQGSPPAAGGGGRPAEPAPSAAPPAAAPAAQGAATVPDTVPPRPEAWPARQVLEENSLAVSTYGPGDPAACGLPGMPAADGRTGVLVFHGCSPRTGPALDAVPARRVAVPAGTDPMRAAVRAQLAGATDAEKSAGYVSNFGPGSEAAPFTVRMMDGGLVVLDVHPSIRSQRMVFVSNAEARQLVAALGQFPGVQRVTILIGGQPLCKALEQC